MARRAPLPTADTIETLDPARVARLRRLAVLLDDSIPIPGTRFRIGVESIVGLVPGAGDLAGGAFSLYIMLQAARMGVPRPLLARMGTNLVVDVVVGAVPILGDLFDVGFKANMRNLALLERHAQPPRGLDPEQPPVRGPPRAAGRLLHRRRDRGAGRGSSTCC